MLRKGENKKSIKLFLFNLLWNLKNILKHDYLYSIHVLFKTICQLSS